jgi:hypothetical protein
MLKANAPTQFTVPFANGASSSYKNVIPIPSQIGVTPGLASYTDGFPPVTMELPGAGGIPPYGQDMNGILYATTLAQLWAQSGFEYPFSSAFSTAVGGYPQNACLMMLTGKGFWLSAVDNNTSNPDTTGASGWFSVRANASSSSVAMAATGATTPDASVLGVSALILTGAITANVTLVLPLASGANWIVENNTTGAFTVTVIGASGTGVAVATGSPAQVFTDGTNFYATTANVSGLYLPIGGNAVSASKLATARTITYTGGATGSFSFDGSSNVSCALTIGASGVTAGTYGSSTIIPQIVVGADGRITGVNNVTVSVPSVFGRTGAVVLTAADINGLGALNLTNNLTVTPSVAPQPITAGKGAASLAYQATGAFGGGIAFNDAGGSAYWGIYDNAGVLSFGLASTATAALNAQITMSNTGLLLAGTSGSNTTLALVNPGVRQFNIVVNTAGAMNFNNATGSTTAMSISASSVVTVGSSALSSASLQVVTSGSTYTAGFTDTGGNGAGLGIFGNGSTTPNKYIRAQGGSLQVVNSAYSGVVLTLTDTGGLTCATGNFTSSDETLKHAITPIHPRPFHRDPLAFVSFKWNDTALGDGLGTTAQAMKKLEPRYVGKWNISPDVRKPDWRLTVDKPQAAYEQGIWCGREIDKLLARVAALEARP